MKHQIPPVTEILVSNYTYDLPESKIAGYPAKFRDRSKLLLYRNGISEHVFSDLPNLIPADTVLVFNNSKVIKARMIFSKTSGAEIEIFCLSPVEPTSFDEALNSERKCLWYCTVGNAKRWKDEILEKEFQYAGKHYRLKARKISAGNEFLIAFEWDAPVNFSTVLDLCGNVPIPPYLKRSSEQIDELSYQTVFSKFEGSVAAPTAGLHFTPEVLNALKNKGISTEEITLHVGAGTFKPIKGETANDHLMHRETFILNRSVLERLIAQAGKIIAVGTTSARMLESLYWLGVLADTKTSYDLGQWEPYGTMEQEMPAAEAFSRLLAKMDKNGATVVPATTEIMIVPGYKFRTIKGLITNFHQPKSTLILLVAALLGNDWKRVYEYALNNDFRFLSYGDCSLLYRLEV